MLLYQAPLTGVSLCHNKQASCSRASSEPEIWKPANEQAAAKGTVQRQLTLRPNPGMVTGPGQRLPRPAGGVSAEHSHNQ